MADSGPNSGQSSRHLYVTYSQLCQEHDRKVLRFQIEGDKRDLLHRGTEYAGEQESFASCRCKDANKVRKKKTLYVINDAEIEVLKENYRDF